MPGFWDFNHWAKNLWLNNQDQFLVSLLRVPSSFLEVMNLNYYLPDKDTCHQVLEGAIEQFQVILLFSNNSVQPFVLLNPHLLEKEKDPWPFSQNSVLSHLMYVLQIGCSLMRFVKGKGYDPLNLLLY